MREKIIGVTVGTPISPKRIGDKLKPVKTVNGVEPDKNGNVDVKGGFGGYYTPEIKQVDPVTAQVTFTASDADMPPVASAHIYLPKGQQGNDGISPTVAVSTVTGGHRITITDADGTKTVNVMDGKDGGSGKDGSNGKDGTSVTVKSVTESTADGGSNVVTFSDGKTITIKNGNKGSKGDKGDSIKGDTGSPGADGVSPTVSVSKSGKVTTVSITDKNGTKTATINDGADGSNGKDGTSATHSWSGTTLTVTSASGTSSANLKGDKGDSVKGDKGDTGADGQRGTGILKVTTTPTSYTTTTNGVAPIKRMAISTITKEAGVSEVLVGDCISHSYYLYRIYYLDATYAYMDKSQSIRGSAGSAGAAGADGKDGADGKNGIDGQEGKSAYELWLEQGNSGTVADFLNSLKGASGMTQSSPLYAESLEWLEANGETDKLYVLPSGFIYGYYKSESTKLYTDRLPSADTDTLISGDLTTATKHTGYFEGVRLNSSGKMVSASGHYATGFIPYTYQGANDRIKIKNAAWLKSNYSLEVCFYDSSHAFLGYAGFASQLDNWDELCAIPAKDRPGWVATKESDGKYMMTWTPSEMTNISNGTIDTSKIAYIRICMGDFANAIITINEEIIEGGSTGGMGWNNTGHAFVPANYESRINDLETRLNNIAPKSGNVDLDHIRNWDMPIYDAHIPVFETTATKAAILDSERNPASLYAKYDSLMAQYPRYITKTDHGLCSDGVNHLYQYDFKTPNTDHTGSLFSETKPKAFLMSGIHQEPGGAYGLYYALEELVSNPALKHLLNNVHLIVLPCANPYAFDTADINNVYLNANGVEIHRNFEVGFVYPGETGYKEPGDIQHGGTAPLSEIESQVIDNIMKANQDMAFVLSCHTFNNASGKDVMWGSCGTKYTCNLVCRLIQKMSVSFLDRFGSTFTGIDSDNPTMGWVSISGTGGSEYRQATKYGIQGYNLEVSETFAPHDKTKRTSFAMTRYAEVYANMLMLAFGVYDYKDKDKYCVYRG